MHVESMDYLPFMVVVIENSQVGNVLLSKSLSKYIISKDIDQFSIITNPKILASSYK